jgi:hypothetical protein
MRLSPSVTAGELLRRNLAVNGVGDAVHFFNSGLSTHTHRETTGDETLNFVYGVPFVIANLPTSIDLLKMDCEGCEYPLFEDERLSGPGAAGRASEEARLLVEIVPCGDTVGYIYAKRAAA